MSANAVPFPEAPLGKVRLWVQCNSRWIVLVILGLTIVGLFWFGSRYPALFSKAHHSGDPLASMAYSHETLRTSSRNSILVRIALGSFNWLSSMAIGMTFGITFGALLHTVLKYYPLRIGQNLTLNTLKGALVGMPMGVCANCAVPMACGLTRGQGRVEVALGYLFSSPNFNPVVIAITFSILPWYFGAVKYAVLLAVILLFVPRLIRSLEKRGNLRPLLKLGSGDVCGLDLSTPPCQKPILASVREVSVEFGRNLFMLFKPTIALMVGASILASALLVLVPWHEFLGAATPLRMLAASLLGVLMPVPIALDVLFAGELHRTGINAGYCMMFLMTLGTYSMVPATYLWREISRTVSVALLVLFLVLGAGLGFAFTLAS